MSDASLSPVSIINLHMVPNKMAAPLTAVMNKAPPVWRRKKKKAEEDVMAAKKRPAEAAAAAAVGSSTTMGHNNIAEKETEAVEEEAARNSMTVMSVQALATAEEAVDGPGATLGDMEVALRAIKNPSPVPSPSQHTDMLNGDGSAVSAQGKHSSWKQFVTPIKGGTAVETFSSQSPTSQFEYDIMEATHKTLDFDDLHKSRSFALMDDNKSTSSEESLTASYRPRAGLVLRKDGCLPELLKDEVIIRVDATTISTRDCLERLRRDSNEELKDDVWVPGHEIVGHVVRTGMNAEFLLDQRVAALLPYGGGCSQYVCISSEDVIALPEEAGSNNDVIALLSTFFTARQCLESVVGVEAEEEAEDVESKVECVGQERSLLYGKNVLIVGAGSPVGLALVDLARNAGANVYPVSHSISHLNAILWAGIIDLIVDTVLDHDNNPSLYKVMKTRARIVRVNITSCEKKYFPLEKSLFGFIFGHSRRAEKDMSYYGRVINDKAIDYDVFHSFNEDKELFREDLAYLLDLLKVGKIRPKIFSRVGFDKLEGEWEKVMSRGANGGFLVCPCPETLAPFHYASYNPGVGLVLRKDGLLPKLLKDEVLIRVDATTISTRDCLERLRHDTNKELKDDVWLPGHEIVGHVVRTGTNAEFLLDQRVAALLPYGGGCSQYACISSKDVIALPEEAGSNNDVIVLLSAYMTAYQCLESAVGIEEVHRDDAGKRSHLAEKNVLIVGAGSPVGLALVDLARNAGANVYTVSHSISHLTAIRAKAMGAHYWYGFSDEGLWEAKWAGEMHLIVDTIGDPDNNPSLYKVMKSGAHLVRANLSSCDKPRSERTQFGFGIFGDGGKKTNVKAIDYDVFHSFKEDKELFTKDLAYLLDLHKGGKIRPRIVSRVGFNKLKGEWEFMSMRNDIAVVSPWTNGYCS